MKFRSKETLREEGVRQSSESIINLRYRHHLNKIREYLNEIINERNTIIGKSIILNFNSN